VTPPTLLASLPSHDQAPRTFEDKATRTVRQRWHVPERGTRYRQTRLTEQHIFVMRVHMSVVKQQNPKSETQKRQQGFSCRCVSPRNMFAQYMSGRWKLILLDSMCAGSMGNRDSLRQLSQTWPQWRHRLRQTTPVAVLLQPRSCLRHLEAIAIDGRHHLVIQCFSQRTSHELMRIGYPGHVNWVLCNGHDKG